MQVPKRLLYLLGVILLLSTSIVLWLGDDEGNLAEEEIQPQIKQSERDGILAEDLALTSSLFIQQLAKQLEEWAKLDFSGQTLTKEFEQEINDHPHFNSFALIKDNRVVMQTAHFPDDPFAVLDLKTKKDQSLIYSDPYTSGEKPFMLIARQDDDHKQWFVGEVDLAFIKDFIGDMASVADANGHFFIGGEQTDVQVKDKQQTNMKNEQSVPEVGWTIVVQSQESDSQDMEEHYREGEVLVKFASKEAADNWLVHHQQFNVLKRFDAYCVLRHPEQSTADLIQYLQTDPHVQKVEPNYIYTKQEQAAGNVPNDEFFAPYQWNLSQIKAEAGWDITEGAENVTIAVLDTGVEEHHQDLAAKLVDGFNVIEENDDFQDQHGHGTHVAGIAAAVTNNLTGIAGVSWHNTIMPVKVLNEKGEGGLFELINGIIWATDHGAKVINMSLGDEEHSDLLYDAIRYAYEHDVVLVAAAGNDNVDVPMYPAAYPEVLAVSAVDHLEEKAVFSNYGDYMDVAAPGEHIPSTFVNDQYVFMSGTSMAAPHVAGLAGLIRSLHPELSNREVMNLIRQTADDLGPPGHDPYYGYGQINVYQALDHLSKGKSIVDPDAQQNGTPESIPHGETQEPLHPVPFVIKWINRLIEWIRT
ncbi:type VII secretion-associated serine protease mycosin [Caldalkalibacillus uzonensis]|uniref:Type VII secretion-associated serine protease mycosin n=1 Tax=Caldalkalibacillus uzonensis TaxID=353224 RepID=A0ABU0CM72_9BACI|nr:S8 family peptidase [Caldalkalibacillus uzonensis]MDQ0337522.1 type VII secretion-associated serine protease mycosin [Caldalkalibacillus uzonensis]